MSTEEEITKIQKRLGDLEISFDELNYIFTKKTGKLYDVEIPALVKFGGDGSDGALNISSGTTTIDAASAEIVVKNYSSISITGTADLTISNPHANGTVLYLRSQGAVIITSSTSPAIKMSALGGTAGTGGAAQTDGTSGSDGMSTATPADAGTFGLGGNTTASVAGGTASVGYAIVTKPYVGYVIACGAGGSGGGGGGAGTGSAGGAGGRGGGVIIIECGRTYNVTSTLSVAGANGTAGTTQNGERTGGGGGGGGGGVIICLYKTLTADSGTYTVTGGNGGNGGSTDVTSLSGGGGGSGGAGLVNAGGAGGSTNSSGANGSGTGGGTAGAPQGAGTNGRGGGGGGGGAGFSLVAKNIYFQ